MEICAVFLLGVAAGIAWYKHFIIYILGRYTHTMCDYCEFAIKKNELFPPMFSCKKK